MKSAALEDSPLKARLRERFRGTLLGLAIGDAAGFPHEGTSRAYLHALGPQLLDRFHKHRSGFYPLGQFSDETQLTLATIEGILARGAVDPRAIRSAYLPLWRENTIIGRDPEVDQVMTNLASDREEAALPEGFPTAAVAKRVAGIGLWDYDQPTRLREDVLAVGGITHRDAQALAGAAAVAAAIAHNVRSHELMLGVFLDEVAGAAAHFDPAFAARVKQMPRFLSMNEHVVHEEFQALGAHSLFLDPRSGLTRHVLPVVLLALYYFLRSPLDYLTTIRGCLLIGGNPDTVSAIAGAVSGALNGADNLAAGLAAKLLHRERILTLADRLFALKAHEK